MKIKLLVKRLALVGVTLSMVFLVGEFIVRTVVYVPRGTPYVAENPDTVYISKPNISGHHISPGEFNYRFKTSSLGFRSAELGAEQVAVPRILCLGDSFTFGVGARDAETWPAQLEVKLTAAGKKTEVVNAGVMGWGLAEYWIWTSSQAPKFAPKLIVIGCHAGDWRNAHYGLVSMDANGRLERHQVIRKDVSRLKAIAAHVPLYDTMMTHSAIANLLKQTVVRLTKQGTTGGASGSTQTSPTASAVSRLEQAAPVNRALLAGLKQVAADMGAGLLIVFIPSAGEMEATGYDVAYRRFRELIQRWTQELAIPHVDATLLLQGHLDRDALPVSALYHGKDGHCTPAGYQVIAEGIADAILKHPEWLVRPNQPPATNR